MVVVVVIEVVVVATVVVVDVVVIVIIFVLAVVVIVDVSVVLAMLVLMRAESAGTNNFYVIWSVNSTVHTVPTRGIEQFVKIQMWACNW